MIKYKHVKKNLATVQAEVGDLPRLSPAEGAALRIANMTRGRLAAELRSCGYSAATADLAADVARRVIGAIASGKQCGESDGGGPLRALVRIQAIVDAELKGK